MFDWLINLQETGELPSAEEVLNTVSAKAFYSKMMIFRCRDQYIRHYGFPIITKELAVELANELSGKKVLEVCCGTGYTAKCIMAADPSIKFICTDNYSWESKFSKWNEHYVDVENIDAIDAVDKYIDQVDYIMISWPEYLSDIATKVLEKCIAKNVPLIYIGEAWGGCTADDSFFELIDESCEVDKFVSSYIPFNGLHDDIQIITKKYEAL